MKLPVIIIGAGGHAKVLVDALRLGGTKIIGIIDSNISLIGKEILGVKILGNDDVIREYSSSDVELVNGLGSVASTEKRKDVFNNFKSIGFYFSNVIHPSAIISSDVIVGEGVQIMAGAIIQVGSSIGSNSIVNTQVSVDHDCFIGDHVHLAPGVTLSGGVKIEDGVHVGIGAKVIQGIKMGGNAIVGAGSLVLNNVPKKVIVVGVPAQEIKR